MMTIQAGEAPSPSVHARAHWHWVTVAMLILGLWTWAIAGCADEWYDNPMYSYGWFVPPLMVFFAWRRLDEPFAGIVPFEAPRVPRFSLALAIAATVLAFLTLPVELLRNELPDDRLNNWGIAICAVVATLWVAYCAGGPRLLLTLAFPIAFFLTAVAWPKRYETPVTVGLQKMVAVVIVEIMHILGIHAEPHGTTIYLRNGPVGIAEACSGIRSLQASLMISLAVGELFFLRLFRRLGIIVLCALVATVLNLGRTLALCLITEYQGADAMHKAHDLIGDAVLVVLPLIAWGVGKLLTFGDGSVPTAPLPRRAAEDGTPPPTPYWKRLWLQVRELEWRRMPNFAPAIAIGLAGVATYHAWLMVLDRRDPPQDAPYFTVRTGEGSKTTQEEMSPDIWAALSPSSGGTYIHRQPSVPGGRISLYHFFWKPAAANRWVTGHRPDVCMPAGGWKKDGEVQPIDISFDGQVLRLHVFRFAGVGQRALQVWGIWRNGEAIQMDFFNNPTLEWSLLTGKSRSAVEVVSCVVPYLDEQPPLDLAQQIMTSVFEYRRPQKVPTEAASARAPIKMATQSLDASNAILPPNSNSSPSPRAPTLP
ncbi:MAG: exosortase/archaeosortase family protein [Verrucomicrobiales bacterium]|nr:exosortase/archaeosortase family protein [Verrucomicrobiales bacterium]